MAHRNDIESIWQKYTDPHRAAIDRAQAEDLNAILQGLTRTEFGPLPDFDVEEAADQIDIAIFKNGIAAGRDLYYAWATTPKIERDLQAALGATLTSRLLRKPRKH